MFSVSELAARMRQSYRSALVALASGEELPAGMVVVGNEVVSLRFDDVGSPAGRHVRVNLQFGDEVHDLGHSQAFHAMTAQELLNTPDTVVPVSGRHLLQAALTNALPLETRLAVEHRAARLFLSGGEATRLALARHFELDWLDGMDGGVEILEEFAQWLEDDERGRGHLAQAVRYLAAARQGQDTAARHEALNYGLNALRASDERVPHFMATRLWLLRQYEEVARH
jgi:hypothetical protein